ncbi:helix-turn-helix domain-containing protein [Streptomyces sp. HSG2]|uniref:helix-turn-helix domain-containing protein n=1 Tax=Streptomyces sp. HSG2 TaxID=2797167 RepID=UPI001F5BCEEA|nr:helix-turn-helix domain-containing protein [Streptomyces sp. HSG2]
MPRPERSLDPTAGPLEEFAHALRELRRQAGNPSYRIMAKRAHYSVATLSEAARGLHKPSLKVTLAYVVACGGAPEAWKRRWHQLDSDLEGREPPSPTGTGGSAPAPPGRRSVTRAAPGSSHGTPTPAPSTPQPPPGSPRRARAGRATTPPATDGRGPTSEALTADEQDELRRLRSEVARLRHANAVLKAASAIFAADLRTNGQLVYNPGGRQDPSA